MFSVLEISEIAYLNRISRWSPLQLGANLSLWLDASDASTITLNGSTVSQWNDKSGNARHATQATAANQPGWGVGRNLFLWSEEFQQTAWSKEGISISQNVAIAPNNTLTADKIIPNTTANVAHVVFNAAAVSVVNGVATWTIRAKAAEYNFVTLGAAVPAGRYSATFNLTTGATTKTATSGSPTSTSNSAKQLANGWWELSITVTTTDAAASYILLGASSSGTPTQDASLNIIDAGDGTSGVLVWGAQINPGTTADFYQRTTTASQPLLSGINGLSTLAWPLVSNPRHMATSASVPARDVYVVTQYATGLEGFWITGYQGIFGGAGGEYIGCIGDVPSNNLWYNFNNFQNTRRNGGSSFAAGNSIPALPLPSSIINISEPAIVRNSPISIGMDRNLSSLNRGWSGMIGEIIVLTEIASDATRQAIEGYLAWKWSNIP